uniref:Uncharacterized protein n=1 Tax=Paramormyrops kingsleyae TaxID=1676925 RepID=A0A3B3RUD7_9TELE
LNMKCVLSDFECVMAVESATLLRFSHTTAPRVYRCAKKKSNQWHLLLKQKWVLPNTSKVYLIKRPRTFKNCAPSCPEKAVGRWMDA